MSLELELNTPHIVQNTSFLAVAALFAQLWDWVTRFSDEVEYIWSGKMTILKCLYIVGRYGILVGQIAQQVLTYWATFSVLHITLCRSLFLLRGVVAQIALTCLEIILVFRLYAMYNQTYRIRRILIGVLLVSLTLEYGGSVIIFRVTSQATSCTPPRAPSNGLMLFVAGTTFNQVAVVALTLVRTCCSRGFKKTELASLMLGEGLGTFSLVTGINIPMCIYEVLRGIGNVSIDAAFAWYLALISIVACRLVIRLRKLATNARKRCDPDQVEEELERLDPTLPHARRHSEET